MRSHSARIWSRSRSVGTPSTPGAPPFRSTRFRAASMFSLATTCSISLPCSPRGDAPPCAGCPLRPPAVPCGFTATSGEQAPCGVFCVCRGLLERNGFTPLLTFGPSRSGRPPAGTMAYLDVVHSNSLNLAVSHHFTSCHLAQTNPLDERLRLLVRDKRGVAEKSPVRLFRHALYAAAWTGPTYSAPGHPIMSPGVLALKVLRPAYMGAGGALVLC